MGPFPLSGRHLIAAGMTLLALSGCAHSPAAEAQATPFARKAAGPAVSLPDAETDRHITEASQRFGLPQDWIRAVMRAESAGKPRAVSPKGAMGLMQIMPATWAELRTRHGLGSDPFDPRDNILAGAAYLSELHDRFGSPGFLAAYNAGPGRYGEHLTTGRPLPPETRRYVAVLAPLIGGAPVAGTERSVAGPAQNPGKVTAPDAQSTRGITNIATSADWRTAPLFIVPPQARSSVTGPPTGPQRSDVSDASPVHAPEPSGGLFPPAGHGDRP